MWAKPNVNPSATATARLTIWKPGSRNVWSMASYGRSDSFRLQPYPTSVPAAAASPKSSRRIWMLIGDETAEKIAPMTPAPLRVARARDDLLSPWLRGAVHFVVHRLAPRDHSNICDFQGQ